MVLRLAGALEIPLRERNALLLAPDRAGVRGTIPRGSRPRRRQIDGRSDPRQPRSLSGSGVDRHWNLLSANGAAQALIGSVDAALLTPAGQCAAPQPPSGRSRRADRQFRRVARPPARPPSSPGLGERRSGPRRSSRRAFGLSRSQGAAAGSGRAGDRRSLKLRTEAGVLSLVSFTTVFGAPLDITLAELALESFFPADAITGEVLRALAAKRGARDAA